MLGTASPSLHPPLPPKSSFTCEFDVSVCVGGLESEVRLRIWGKVK